MQDITQLHNTSPDKFKKEILDGVKQILSEFIGQKNSKETFLTRKELAAALSISLPTLRNYVKRGLIKESRVGSRVLYKWKDVLAAFPETKIKK